MKKKVMILLLGLLCFSITLTGCKDTGGSEATEAKAELTKVKSILEQTQKERDDLKVKVADITESLKSAQTKIEGLLQSSNQAIDIKDKLARLTEERDTTIAKATEAQDMVGKLKGQLAEQIKKVTGLQDQNKKLQGIIDELKKKLSSEVEIPAIPGL